MSGGAMTEESILGLTSSRLRSDQKGWVTLGTITESQTTLGASNSDWDSVEALATAKVAKGNVFSDTNFLELRFQTDGTGDSWQIEIWLARGEDHYARMVTLDLSDGTQVGDNGQYFIETIAKSELMWPARRDEIYGSGNNSIARYWIDLLGYSKILIIAPTIESGSTLTVQRSRV